MANPIRRIVGSVFLMSAVATAIGAAWTLPSWSERLPWHHRGSHTPLPRSDEEIPRSGSGQDTAALPHSATAASSRSVATLPSQAPALATLPSQASAGTRGATVAGAVEPAVRSAAKATLNRAEGDGTESAELPTLAAINVAAIMAPTPPPTPPPAPLAEETELRQSLETVVARYPTTKLTYSVCQGDGEPCRARVEGRDLAAVTKAAEEARGKLAGVAAVDVHELPTAYNGRLYVADIETKPAAAQPVQPSQKAL